MLPGGLINAELSKVQRATVTATRRLSAFFRRNKSGLI
jgi:hypothetical protein